MKDALFHKFIYFTKNLFKSTTWTKSLEAKIRGPRYSGERTRSEKNPVKFHNLGNDFSAYFASFSE